jgi:hypothetical protein
MTDAPKNSNRGGARPGSGPKRKAQKATTVLDALDLRACAAPMIPARIAILDRYSISPLLHF